MKDTPNGNLHNKDTQTPNGHERERPTQRDPDRDPARERPSERERERARMREGGAGQIHSQNWGEEMELLQLRSATRTSSTFVRFLVSKGISGPCLGFNLE